MFFFLGFTSSMLFIYFFFNFEFLNFGSDGSDLWKLLSMVGD
jgi:hypothetical protein